MRRPPYRAALLLLALTALAAAGGWRRTAAAPPAPGLPPAAVDPARLASALGDAPEALRRGDCRAGLASAASLAARARSSGGGGADSAAPSVEPRAAALVAGLYAAACGESALAVERLAEAGAPEGAAAPFDDWRLLVLARTAAESGRPGEARRALDELLARHPASPLRSQAYAAAAELAWERSDAARAVELAEAARSQGVAGEPRLRLDELTWRIAAELADPATARAAARDLLVHFPARADELKVGAALAAETDAGGAGSAQPWRTLGPDELRRRAANLLALRRPGEAVAALQAVPTAERDLEWHLAAAEALTAERRGPDALALLAGLEAGETVGTLSAAERTRLEWARAEAALGAARPRSGDGAPDAAARARYRQQADQHLARVAASSAERRLAARALARLFADRWDEGRYDAALQVLRRLREVDPTDLTGARVLWQAGWNEYTGRNHTGAVGHWAELAGLYPESSYTRAGRYWTARAWEELGDRERARALYRQVAAAETADHYTRQAVARLGGTTTVPEGAPLAVDRGLPWPEHPDFFRARVFADLGLDALGLEELAAVRGRGDGGEAAGDAARRRAAAALEARLLAGQGRHRAAIQRLVVAFPALGGPFQAMVPLEARYLYHPVAHEAVVRETAERRDLPAHLVFGMIRQESAFDLTATSHAGARGLMQLMPATAREMAGRLGLPFAPERLNEPAYNVTVGTAYFRQVLGIFDGNLELALAGYNGGPYRIRRLWREAAPGTPMDRFIEGLPVDESRIYVKRILMLADGYRQLHPEGAG